MRGVNGGTRTATCHCRSNLCTRSGPRGHVDRSSQLWKNPQICTETLRVCHLFFTADAQRIDGTASSSHRRRRIFAWKYPEQRGRPSQRQQRPRNMSEKKAILTSNSYLVHNIHLGRSLADKRISGAEGGRRLARNSPREEDTREEEPTASRARAKGVVTSEGGTHAPRCAPITARRGARR